MAQVLFGKRLVFTNVILSILLAQVYAKRFLGTCNYEGFCEQECRRVTIRFMECYCRPGYLIKPDGRKCMEAPEGYVPPTDTESSGSGDSESSGGYQTNCDNEDGDCGEGSGEETSGDGIYGVSTELPDILTEQPDIMGNESISITTNTLVPSPSTSTSTFTERSSVLIKLKPSASVISSLSTKTLPVVTTAKMVLLVSSPNVSSAVLRNTNIDSSAQIVSTARVTSSKESLITSSKSKYSILTSKAPTSNPFTDTEEPLGTTGTAIDTTTVTDETGTSTRRTTTDTFTDNAKVTDETGTFTQRITTDTDAMKVTGEAVFSTKKATTNTFTDTIKVTVESTKKTTTNTFTDKSKVTEEAGNPTKRTTTDTFSDTTKGTDEADITTKRTLPSDAKTERPKEPVTSSSNEVEDDNSERSEKVNICYMNNCVCGRCMIDDNVVTCKCADAVTQTRGVGYVIRGSSVLMILCHIFVVIFCKVTR